MTTLVGNRLPDLPDEYTHLQTHHHDTRGISPIHVSVLEAIAAVIGVNPKKTSLHLSDHVSIQALDSIPDCAKLDGEPSALAFRYREFSVCLFLIVECDGDIYVYQDETEKCNPE